MTAQLTLAEALENFAYRRRDVPLDERGEAACRLLLEAMHQVERAGPSSAAHFVGSVALVMACDGQTNRDFRPDPRSDMEASDARATEPATLSEA